MRCTGVEIRTFSDLSFGQVLKKIYLSDEFSTCPLVKIFINYSYFARPITIRIDGNFYFGQPSLRNYLSDPIFTCPGHADNL